MDYWTPKLLKRSYAWEGKEIEIPEWQVRIAHLGRREWFNTGTANKAAAAETARKIYLSLISKGWQPTLDQFKPDMQVSKDGATVGDFLDQVKAVSGLKPVTYEIYAKKFRSLVAGVCRIDGGVSKHDYVNGGHKAWLEKVHAIRLDKLTPDKINEWKVRELKAASANPLQLKRAGVTVRSVQSPRRSPTRTMRGGAPPHAHIANPPPPALTAVPITWMLSPRSATAGMTWVAPVPTACKRRAGRRRSG